MEFRAGGRISQLWASDPGLPEEGEEFQFVLPAVQFGEETADSYFPGTILLGVRSDPDDPWVVSKNQTCKDLNPWEDENYDPAKVAFEYEFPLIEGLRVTGTYYESPGTVPQVCWDIEVKNVARRTIEIGELGLPMAFNNFIDGFGWTDEQLKRLWTSRLYLHKAICGGASWLFAQRMTAEAPGLLVFPGDNTAWEFYSHVRGSLNTPFPWEGIPVMYVLSKATVEREEWRPWENDHTSLILEPGDSRTFQTRFVPCESDKLDGVSATLAACGRPAIRLLPSAVSPTDVGVAIEVTGHNPDRFYVSREAAVEVDTDTDGSFCFVKPDSPGFLTVSFADKDGLMCHAHLLFIEPVRSLIAKRAAWIARNQVVLAEGSTVDRAIVMAKVGPEGEVYQQTDFDGAAGLEGSLSDALFLAEKNSVYPEPAEIKVLDEFVEQFLLDDLQNPGTGAVASVITEGIPGYFGRPMSYPMVANLYHSISRVARVVPGLSRTPTDYLRLAARTVEAQFEHGWRLYVRSVGTLGFARLWDLVDDLEHFGLTDEAESVRRRLIQKSEDLVDLQYPYAGETVMDTSGFEEVFVAAKTMEDDDHLERTVRCAFAAKSLAPSWWWYGSDKRFWDGGDSVPAKAVGDRGEMCQAHTTVATSLVLFGSMDKDYLGLPDAYVRMAFGGMLGPWGLVSPEGAASLCYCPDLSSKQAGFSAFTGSSGLGYYHYLRGTGAYVLPNNTETYAFGCHYSLENGQHIVRPWDGVGRNVVLRQIGGGARTSFGVIQEFRLDVRLRSFSAKVENPSVYDVQSDLLVSGLWGTEIEVEGKRLVAQNGVFRIPLKLPAKSVASVSGAVV